MLPCSPARASQPCLLLGDLGKPLPGSWHGHPRLGRRDGDRAARHFPRPLFFLGQEWICLAHWSWHWSGAGVNRMEVLLANESK